MRECSDFFVSRLLSSPLSLCLSSVFYAFLLLTKVHNLAPKTPLPSSRVPQLLSEIHRATSREVSEIKTKADLWIPSKRLEPLQ
tara:strand:- start:189 stop:440 length:252 start_codon:yes stop_codon:yes gene_type:complete